MNLDKYIDWVAAIFLTFILVLFISVTLGAVGSAVYTAVHHEPIQGSSCPVEKP